LEILIFRLGLGVPAINIKQSINKKIFNVRSGHSKKFPEAIEAMLSNP
jgi:hypothetical protein